MNESIIIPNITLENIRYGQEVKWEDIINEYCDNWRSQSTYAYKEYFVLVLVIIGLGVIGRFWNPRIYYKFTDDFYIFGKKIEGLVFNEYIITYIRSIVDGILHIRIMQIFLIITYYLGGFN